MSRTVNPHLWALFDRSLIMQALQGHGEFFIPNGTYREQHDETLVLRQLVLWADDREKWPVALAAVESTLRQSAEANDLQKVVGLAWAALLVGDDMHEVLLTDEAVQLAGIAATQPGYPPETEAIAQAVRHRLAADSE